MKVTAVLSLLHEQPGRPGSATRKFRGEAPLAWSLFRLARCTQLADFAVVCWQDQAEAVTAVAEEMKVKMHCPGERKPVAHLDGVAAARRWADGWRGGLLGACEFDRGFHGPTVNEILSQTESDAILLVDPSAGLVDFQLVDQLIEHADANPGADLYFSQAAPGLSGVLLRNSLIRQLATGGSHPGTLLAYRPDLPTRDPISTPACAPVPTPLARTGHRFTLDSDRQIDRIANATVHLNGQLISTEAEQLLRYLDAAPQAAPLPREVVVELTPRRSSKPVFSPLSSAKINRAEMTLDIAKTIFAEMSQADDARLIFAGVGDPLLHADFASIVAAAHDCGVGAIAIETDLLGISPETIDWLAESPIDIIGVHLPAISNQTYHAVMGVDGLRQVMSNLTRLIQRRRAAGRGTPLVSPIFVKTAANFAEMDPWYDHWLRVLGCAVIEGPSSFAAQIPDVAMTQMHPPRRGPCVRINNRLTILSDGSAVSCEQDFLATRPLGKIGEQSIRDIWAGGMASLRREHAGNNWNCNGLCAACKDWHRP